MTAAELRERGMLVAALKLALARILQLGGEEPLLPDYRREDGTIDPAVWEPDPTCERIRAALAAVAKGVGK